jgi:uncharacterized protein YprB with RNaseH-like and TPR domain
VSARTSDIDLFDQDVPLELVDDIEVRAKENGLAVDIETTGLDLAVATVQIVSLAVPDMRSS